MGEDTEPRKWSAARSTLAQLRELVAALPTNAERDELGNLLDTLIRFLTDLRSNLGLLPTSETLAEVEAGLKRFDELLEKASASRLLAPAVGVKPKKVVSHSTDTEELNRAKRQLHELQMLPIDEIKARLLRDEPYTLGELRTIAFVAGMRRADRMPREAIAHELAMKIANRRGYEGLSAGEDTSK